MKPRALVTFVLSAVLLVSSCANGGPGDPDGPGGPGQPGQTNPFNGRLIARGSGNLHTMNLTTNGEWVKQLPLPVQNAQPYVRSDSNELYVSRLNAANPLIIDIYDLSTFGKKEHGYVWPGTDNMLRASQLAVAPGGRYLAVLMRGFSDDFLEIYDTQAEEVVFTGFDGTIGTNLIWTSDLDLIFAMNFQGQGGAEVYGGIVAVPLAEFLDGDEQFDIKVLHAFNQQQWGTSGVYDLALSHDEKQIAFVRSGDIWAKDLATGESPRQLTTGPTGSWGPAFSPDGNHIVFVGAQGLALRDTLIVNNDSGGPYMVHTGDHSVTEVYILDRRYLVEDILAWLP